LLIAVGNTNVDAFPEGFFTKLTNFFRKKPTPPPVEVSTYQRYDSPDEDLFSNIHSGFLFVFNCSFSHCN
uniref:Uncharacterized protein n=1 Tax=Parascaris equorum TaxID=6256 RepID=A0A914R3P2_PAREQ